MSQIYIIKDDLSDFNDGGSIELIVESEVVPVEPPSDTPVV
jgi:hypothetical protein